MKIYLAGSVPKGDKEAESFLNWREVYSEIILKKFNSENLQFIDPYERDLDEGDSLMVFGKDCSQIKNCDLIVVNAENKLGVGTSQELVIAKYFDKPVVTVLPKDSAHRKSNVKFGGKLVIDWKHPFIECFSDLVYERVEEINFDQVKNIQIKKINIIDMAIDCYNNKI